MDRETWIRTYGSERRCSDRAGDGQIRNNSCHQPTNTKILTPPCYEDASWPCLSRRDFQKIEEQRRAFEEARKQEPDRLGHSNHRRRYLLRDIAHAAEQAASLVLFGDDSRDEVDLALARVLRALALITATGEGYERLETMAEEARLLLTSDKSWKSIAVHFGGRSSWDALFECEQPFDAWFYVKTRDLTETSRSRFTKRLREAASEWGRMYHEREDMQSLGRREAAAGHEEHMGSVAWIARKTTHELLGVLDAARLDPELSERVGLPSRESWDRPGLYERLKTEVLPRVFRSTKDWHSPDTEEKVVRSFLRALGVSEAKTKNFFRSEPKDPPPTSQRRPRKGPDEAK